MKRAFTLIEVVVSMLLLGLIITGMLATFALVGKGPGKLGVLDLQAANFARETLERLKNAVSEDPVFAAPLTAGFTSELLPFGDFKNKYGGTRTYDTTDIDANGDGKLDYKKVTVTVRWND